MSAYYTNACYSRASVCGGHSSAGVKVGVAKLVRFRVKFKFY